MFAQVHSHPSGEQDCFAKKTFQKVAMELCARRRVNFLPIPFIPHSPPRRVRFSPWEKLELDLAEGIN
jgi:hypothetical protein